MNENRKRVGGCLKWVLAACMAFVVMALLVYVTPLRGKVRNGIHRALAKVGMGAGQPLEVVKEVEVIKEVIKEVPVVKEVPVPPPWVENKTVEVGNLFNGIQIQTELERVPGGLASVERKEAGSYQAEFKVTVKLPAANKTVEDLAGVNPELPKILPGLALMLPSAKVSPFFDEVYEKKLRRMQSDVTRLNKLLDRHNFFDTETILELTHPADGGRALLIQSEMDVVADGSDGARMPKIDNYISMSDHYQPFTGYGWPKKSTTPNPLLTRWEANLKKYEEEYKIKGLPVERNRFLEGQIETLKRGIPDLKARSFLIAEEDPFVVMSLTLTQASGEFAPSIGDYAVVVHGGKIYPAIVGDAGPYYKMGEASLRMAKELNPKSTPYNRPESDLKVTYVVFPGSADRPFDAPDYARWKTRCGQLLDKIGGMGAGYVLHEWEDRLGKAAAVGEPPAAAGGGAAVE